MYGWFCLLSIRSLYGRYYLVLLHEISKIFPWSSEQFISFHVLLSDAQKRYCLLTAKQFSFEVIVFTFADYILFMANLKGHLIFLIFLYKSQIGNFDFFRRSFSFSFSFSFLWSFWVQNYFLLFLNFLKDKCG